MSRKPEPYKKKRTDLTPAQKAARTRAEKNRLEQADAQRLAQVVNLMIAGHSLADIGAAIGATAAEVEQMLATDVSRYVKTQPALRVFVRNWVSAKYTGLLDSVYDRATDKTDAKQLEYNLQALRILERMADLHGAKAPTQSEVKIDAAPEAVEKMVNALAKAQGVGYDMNVFDVVDAEIVEDAVEESTLALEQASKEVERDE